MLRYALRVFLFILITLPFSSCLSVDEENIQPIIPPPIEKNEQPVVQPIKEEESLPESVDILPVIPEEKTEETIEETMEVEAISSAAPIIPIVPTKDEEAEYARSVSNLQAGSTITRDVFQEDKKQVLEIIDILEKAMSQRDYSTWFKYVDPASIKFWRDPRNLKKASERLPIKDISLNNLQSYFKYVFIPSREGKRVDEIRYVSDTVVKVVQVQDDTDIIYYYFSKINGKWMVHLPTL